MKKLLFVLVVFSLMVACTSSQPQDIPAEATVAPQATEAGAASPTPGDEEEQAPTQDLKSTVLDLFNRQASLRFMVKYDLVSSGMQSSMTQYMMGTNNIRMDITTSGIEARTIIKDSTFYSCTKISSSWTCQQINMQLPATSQAETEIKDNADDYQFTYIGSRQIAGTTASCYRMTSQGKPDVDYCFSPEAVPLYVKVTANGVVSELTATEYSTSVSAADFELPAQPGAQAAGMPQIPGNIDIPSY